MITASDLCNRMVEQLEQQSNSCYTMDSDLKPLSIKRMNQDDLAGTLYASELPEHTGHYALPLLNRDGSRTSFGYITAVVDVYRDGTAIAKTREWRYGYRADEPSVDGCARETGRDNKMTVRHYLIGCQHQYVERNDLAVERGHRLFSHDHYYSCDLCGHAYMVDSSD